MADLALRAEVSAAVLAEVERIGPISFRAEVVVKAFLSRGSSKATLYRWIDHVLQSGQVNAHLTAKVKEASQARAKVTKAPARAAAAEIVTKLPAIARIDDIAGQGGTIAVITQLNECMDMARQIMKQARNDDGTIRQTKLALMASEHMRRCLDTGVKMAEAMRAISKIDDFHLAVVDAIAEESPELAERLQMRLHHLTTSWNAA